jgi:putative zinc finger/helix-turn-helix YgiT family protein
MGNNEKKELICPVCNEGVLRERSGEFTTELKDNNEKKELRIKNISWVECDSCGEKIFDYKGIQQINEARYKILGLLTPAELKSIRKKLDLTQEQMAELLDAGNKTYCRWENGTSIQTKSMDNLIRYTVEKKISDLKKRERVNQAATYLRRLKEGISKAADFDEVKLAAHSKNATPSEIEEIYSIIKNKNR